MNCGEKKGRREKRGVGVGVGPRGEKDNGKESGVRGRRDKEKNE